MTTITVNKGDERPDLSGTISFDGSPTLEGATATLTAINVHGTKIIDGGSCSVVIDDSADTIVWTYELQDGDIDTPGTYYIYVTVTLADGDVQTVSKDSDGDPHLLIVERPYG